MHLAVMADHRPQGIFAHLSGHAGIAQADDGDIAGRWAVFEQMIDPGAEGEDRAQPR